MDDGDRIATIRDTLRWVRTLGLGGLGKADDEARDEARDEANEWLTDMIDGLDHPVDLLAGCPLCEEIECDEGCPLAPIRDRLAAEEIRTAPSPSYSPAPPGDPVGG